MAAQTPPIQPIIPAYRIRILSDEQLEQFKSNTFEILEKTGVHCPSERALKIYAEHGGKVDLETQIVKLTSDVILEALSHAPRYYVMGARAEDFDLDLSKGLTYEATDGTGTKTIDYSTGELRASIKDDVAKSARIAAVNKGSCKTAAVIIAESPGDKRHYLKSINFHRHIKLSCVRDE